MSINQTLKHLPMLRCIKKIIDIDRISCFYRRLTVSDEVNTLLVSKRKCMTVEENFDKVKEI